MDISLLLSKSLEPPSGKSNTSLETSYGGGIEHQPVISHAAPAPSSSPAVSGYPTPFVQIPAPRQPLLPPQRSQSSPQPCQLESYQHPASQVSSITHKGTASVKPLPGDSSAKKGEKCTPEEDALNVKLRRTGMKWEDISKRLPGRSATSCRLRYQNYSENRPDWDEEEKTKLARLYDRYVLFQSWFDTNP